MSTSFSTYCTHCKKLSEFQSSAVNGYYSFACPFCHKDFYVKSMDSEPGATRS